MITFLIVSNNPGTLAGMKAHRPNDTETVSRNKKAPRVYLGTLLRGASGKSNTCTGDPNEMDLLKVFFY